MTRALGGGHGGGGGGHGGGHHGGGGRGRGGGFGPAWWGGGYSYPYYDYDYPEVVVVEAPMATTQADEFQRRAMAHIMSMPKAQRAAAYKQIFGKDSPAGALGGSKTWRARSAVSMGDDTRTYAYQNVGAPISWKGGPPQSLQTRAADGTALGIFDKPTLELPLPGAPEVLAKGMNGLGDCGCGCAGKGPCKTAMGDDSTTTRLAFGAAALVAFNISGKSKPDLIVGPSKPGEGHRLKRPGMKTAAAVAGWYFVYRAIKG